MIMRTRLRRIKVNHLNNSKTTRNPIKSAEHESSGEELEEEDHNYEHGSQG